MARCAMCDGQAVSKRWGLPLCHFHAARHRGAPEEWAAVEEWTRQRIEVALRSPTPHITVDDGLWLLERCRPLKN